MSGAVGAESLGVALYWEAVVRHEMSLKAFPLSLSSLSLIDYHLWQKHISVLYLCKSYNALKQPEHPLSMLLMWPVDSVFRADVGNSVCCGFFPISPI